MVRVAAGIPGSFIISSRFFGGATGALFRENTASAQRRDVVALEQALVDVLEAVRPSNEVQGVVRRGAGVTPAGISGALLYADCVGVMITSSPLASARL